MEMLNNIASYWNEFLIEGVGFFVLCVISIAISGFLISLGHKIAGTIIALMGTLFATMTRYALIIGVILGVIKIVLKILVGIG